MSEHKIEDRLGALDGLRGLMALWVLFGHACTASGMAFVPILRSPHYAVDGFMILSGFLMTYHYILRAKKHPWEKPTTWGAFYVRRYFRLSPVYYLLLIPAYVFKSDYDRWGAVVSRLVNATEVQPANPAVGWEHVFLHVTYLFGLFPKYHASLVLPDWSLSLEMQFYLVFPFMMLFILRFGWIAFCTVCTGIWLLATASAVGLTQLFVQPSPLVLSLIWFVIGMLWASAHLDTEKSSIRWKSLLGCGLALVSRDPHDIILVFVFAWLIFGHGRLSGGRLLPALRRALSGKFSHFLASASYSVYLTHLLILVPVAYLLVTRTQWGPVGRFFADSGITIVLAYSLSRPVGLIEDAGIQIGKKLSRRLEAARPSASLSPEPVMMYDGPKEHS